MPNYSFLASNNIGENIKGVLVADDLETLEKILTERGLFLLQAKEQTHTTSILDSFRKSEEDTLLFTVQMATGLESGVPLIEVLEDMVQEMDSGYFKKVIADIKMNVEAGNSLSDAMKLYPNIFSNLYRVIIKTGEESGQLDNIFQYLVNLLEWDKNLKKQVKKAINPIIGILVMLCGLIVIVLTVVLPNFVGLFKSSGAALPLPTQILLTAGDFFKEYWPFIITGAIGSYIGIKIFGRTEAGRSFLDLLKLRMPIIGTLNQKIAMSRFANFWRILFSSGVDLARALQIVAEVVQNKPMEAAILSARSEIINGREMAKAFKETNMFPSLVLRMINLGETTGNLETALNKVTQYYDKEIPEAIDSLIGAIKPIMLIFAAGLILMVAMGIILPMFGMMDAIK